MIQKTENTGDLWRKTTGGPAVRLAGAVILFLGLTMISGSGWPWPLGALCGALGGLLLIGREQVSVDRRNRVAVVSWGLGVTLYRREVRFPRFDAIAVTARERVSRGKDHPSRYYEYTVRIIGDENGAVVHRTTTRQEAYRIAGDLARFLDIPVTGDLLDPV